MIESLFSRVARQERLPAPGLVAPVEDWERHARRVWAAFPPWGYDEAYIDAFCRARLPRVLVALGVGRAVARAGITHDGMCEMEPVLLGPRRVGGEVVWPRWREMFRAAPWLAAETRGDVLQFELSADDAAPLLLHPVSLEWDCPARAAEGDGVLSLAAWRWRISPAKAAWRLARAIGMGRPVP